MEFKHNVQSQETHAIAYSLLRVTIGMLLIINGWNKWEALPVYINDFPDPVGAGSASSLYLVIFAELICGLAIAFGLLTRFSSLPVTVTFIVAVFLVHGNDPFDVKQAAILYLVASVYFFVNGSGRFSLDRLFAYYSKNKRQEARKSH